MGSLAPHGRSACRIRGEGDGGRGYRVAYLARKYGLSHREARELIAAIGHDRERLNAAARRLSQNHASPPAAPRP